MRNAPRDFRGVIVRSERGVFARRGVVSFYKRRELVGFCAGIHKGWRTKITPLSSGTLHSSAFEGAGARKPCVDMLMHLLHG